MPARSFSTIVTTLLLGSLSPVTMMPFAFSEEDDARVIMALDRKVNMEFNDEPIRSVLFELGEAAEVRIELADRVYDCLPYASQTKLTATIPNRPLRDALIALLRPLGLKFKVEKARIVVEPTPPLRRLVRRATWQEAGTLDQLYREAWSQQLFDALKLQFPGSRSDLVSNRETLHRLAQAVGSGPAAEVLEHACNEYGWTWYPEADRIVILPKAKQVDRQLDTVVTLEYDQISLQAALLDLAGRADLLLKMDPGVLNSLPPQISQRFTLTIRNTTVRQALEVVTGQTGLRYYVESEGIRLINELAMMDATSSPSGKADAAVDTAVQETVKALRSNRIVGEVTVHHEDDMSFAFFIREDDLPPEVKQMQEAKIKDAVNRLRKILHSQQQQD